MIQGADRREQLTIFKGCNADTWNFSLEKTIHDLIRASLSDRTVFKTGHSKIYKQYNKKNRISVTNFLCAINLIKGFPMILMEVICGLISRGKRHKMMATDLF